MRAEEERGEAERQHPGAEPIERVPVMLDFLVQRDDEQGRGRDSGGDVDEEHPAP